MSTEPLVVAPEDTLGTDRYRARRSEQHDGISRRWPSSGRRRSRLLGKCRPSSSADSNRSWAWASVAECPSPGYFFAFLACRFSFSVF
jgi:hypothetical protein